MAWHTVSGLPKVGTSMSAAPPRQWCEFATPPTATLRAGERYPLDVDSAETLGQDRIEPELAVGYPRVESQQCAEREQGRS